MEGEGGESEKRKGIGERGESNEEISARTAQHGGGNHTSN